MHATPPIILPLPLAHTPLMPIPQVIDGKNQELLSLKASATKAMQVGTAH